MNEYYVQLNDGSASVGSGWRQVGMRRGCVQELTVDQKVLSSPERARVVREDNELHVLAEGPASDLKQLLNEAAIEIYMTRPTYYPD